MSRGLAALALLLTGAWAPETAHAEVEPAGALTSSLLLAEDSWGGALLADVTAPIGVLRVGGAIGIGALTSDDDARSRVYMPLAVSLGLVARTGVGLWLDLRARAGAWAGATNQGLAAGFWLAAGGYLAYALGPGVAIGAGLEGRFLLGHGDTIAIAPGLTLAWTPEQR